MRDEIMQRRHDFIQLYLDWPKHIFLSLEYHTRLLDELKRKSIVREDKTSLVGDQFCGMLVHVVPTLPAGFSVG